MALCSGRTNMLQLSFSAPFLCYFLLALKVSKEKDLDRQRKNKKIMRDEIPGVNRAK
jgi:hypothetical protein